MDKCKNGIQESEKKLMDNCWTYFYDIYLCSEAFKENNDGKQEWPCKKENDIIEDCITGVVGKSVKGDKL